MPAPQGTVGTPGRAAGTIIYCHGLNRTRNQMLPMARLGHSLGYNGLAFDFRQQGASEGRSSRPARLSSVGFWESRDVVGAIEYALGDRRAARPLVLWGVSLGAAASLLAAAEEPEVAGVVSDSTFLSFEEATRDHWDRFFGAWRGFPMFRAAMRLTAWEAHFRPSDFDLRVAVRQINPRPVLFIGVQGDRRMPAGDIARTLYNLSSSPDRMLLVVPGSRHGEGFSLGHEQYVQAVTNFMGRIALAAQQTTRHTVRADFGSDHHVALLFSPSKRCGSVSPPESR